jgi:predicted RNase H-like nuclease (RuvC/YqgF family)
VNDEAKIHQLTLERDNLLALNRTLEADRAALIADLGKMAVELDETQQISRKSIRDLQREYITLERKYHAVQKRQDECALCQAELEAVDKHMESVRGGRS